MKLFQVVQNKFVLLGIRPNQSRFNKEVTRTCSIYALSTSSSALFLIFKAKSFIEYTSNIYATTAFAMIGCYFTIWIFKTKKFFELIDNMEILVDQREYSSDI